MSGTDVRRQPAWRAGDGWIAAAAASAPWLILGYIAALALLRLSLSPFLEIDEAQFVGHVDLRLVYENSHPPLYNWALRLLLEVTGWNWPVATSLMKYGCLAGFYLLTWDAARRLGGPRAGLYAIAAAAFLPQIAWQSAHTLAHSILVLTGVAAMIHAAVLVWLTPVARNYAWLGLAGAIGALAKYNFFLFAIPFLIALAADPQLRPRIFARGVWISLGVFAALTTPTFIAAALEFGASTDRLSKLYSAKGALAWIDPPGIGVDGFISLIVATLAWGGLLAAAWSLARARPEWRGSPATADPFAPALGRAMAAAMIVFAAIVLAADMHRVHERYLTPLLAGVAIWVAIRRPLGPSTERWVVGASAILLVGVLGGIYAMVQTQKHRYAIPYETVASAIARANLPPTRIVARRHSDVANLVLALDWPGAASPTYPPMNDQALLVWRGDGPPRAQTAPEGYLRTGPVRRVTAGYLNSRTDAVTFSFQALRRR